MTIGQRVWVCEHGEDEPRPAVLREKRLIALGDPQNLYRLIVDFTDSRGGFRDCFRSSVHETRAAAEAAMKG